MRTGFWIAAALSVGLAAAAQAQVSGTVKFDGPAPAMTPIDMSGKPECAAQHKDQPVLDESIVVGKSGGLANVVISVVFDEGVTWDAPKNPNPKDAVLDQKGCQYIPHVLAVEQGGHIIAKNSDPFLHNVHLQAEKNPKDNVQQPGIDPGKQLSAMTEPEYFHFKCEVHAWMSGYCAVLSNPYFAVTDADGKYTLPTGLAAGTYKLHAWHEKLGEQDADLTVGADGKATVDFTYKPGGANAGHIAPVKDVGLAALMQK